MECVILQFFNEQKMAIKKGGGGGDYRVKLS